MTTGEEESKDFLTRVHTTASYKTPVSGKVEVTKNGISGDFVADTVHHGGADKVLFANSFLNYKAWQEFLMVNSLPFGAHWPKTSLLDFLAEAWSSELKKRVTNKGGELKHISTNTISRDSIHRSTIKNVA